MHGRGWCIVATTAVPAFTPSSAPCSCPMPPGIARPRRNKVFQDGPGVELNGLALLRIVSTAAAWTEAAEAESTHLLLQICCLVVEH
eukprot:149936-Pelagomonas_calceolata.AAC.8